MFSQILSHLCNNFLVQYKHKRATTGIPRQPFEGLHILTRRSTHKRTLHILRWTSAVCLQRGGCYCRSRSRGCALYRDALRPGRFFLEPLSTLRCVRTSTSIRIESGLIASALRTPKIAIRIESGFTNPPTE